MTQRNTEVFIENQISSRLQALLADTRTEALKSGVEVGNTFHVEVMQNGTKLLGFDASVRTESGPGGGGAWTYPQHIYADLAGSLRNRANANLELRVAAPLIRKEGIVLDFSAMPKEATAD